MSNFSTMNGINQTRAATGGGLGGSAPRRVHAGMMGSIPGAPLAPHGGFAQAAPQGGRAQYMPQSPNAGVRMPPPVQQSAVPQQAPPQFDPNDPRNAALAGYMNGT